MNLNKNYENLAQSYLFSTINKKVRETDLKNGSRIILI